ncbi:hypothetical protein AGLY_015745 [Aphis glycines]|uniref:Uncharacterized protein n=1 Tax=Aphis glycines TaxID=307491 RepID=A0A6G0T1S6_APHGL|nr:hypothetical protein AGLY_015745 [Aphis glycines]
MYNYYYYYYVIDVDISFNFPVDFFFFFYLDTFAEKKLKICDSYFKSLYKYLYIYYILFYYLEHNLHALITKVTYNLYILSQMNVNLCPVNNNHQSLILFYHISVFKILKIKHTNFKINDINLPVFFFLISKVKQCVKFQLDITSKRITTYLLLLNICNDHLEKNLTLFTHKIPYTFVLHIFVMFIYFMVFQHSIIICQCTMENNLFTFTLVLIFIIACNELFQTD